MFTLVFYAKLFRKNICHFRAGAARIWIIFIQHKNHFETIIQNVTVCTFFHSLYNSLEIAFNQMEIN
jgi:hypothetical protein